MTFAALAALMLSGCASVTSPPSGVGALDLPVFANLHLLAPMGDAAAEPQIATRGNNVVVAAMDFAAGGPGQAMTFHIAIHRSTDAGDSWQAPAPLPPAVRAPFDPAGKLEYVGDPVLVYAPDGALFLAGVAAQGTWADGPAGPLIVQLSALTIFVTRSQDDGVSWSPALYFRQGAGTFGFPVLFAGVIEDKPWIDISPEGIIHLTWTEFTGPTSAILHTSSSDSGSTWKDPQRISMSEGGRLLQASTITSPGQGRVYLSATSYRPSQEYPPTPTPGGEQLVWVSEDQGATFGGSIVVGPASQERWGAIFADRDAPQRVFVTAPSSETKSHVYVVASEDGGASWGEPVWVGANSSGAQVQPTGWVDEAHRPTVTFYDDGWPGGTQLLVVRLLSNGSLETIPAPGPHIEHGPYRRDYFGVAPISGGAFIAWTGGEGDSTWTNVARFATLPQ